MHFLGPSVREKQEEGATGAVQLVLDSDDGHLKQGNPDGLRSLLHHHQEEEDETPPRDRNRRLLLSPPSHDSKETEGESVAPSSWNASSTRPAPAAAMKSSSSSTSVRTSYSTFESESARTGCSRSSGAPSLAPTAVRPHQRSLPWRIRKLWQGSRSSKDSNSNDECPCALADASQKRIAASSLVRVVAGAMVAAALVAAAMLNHRSAFQSPRSSWEHPPLQELDLLDDRSRRDLEWRWDRNVYRPPPPNNAQEPQLVPHPNRSPPEDGGAGGRRDAPRDEEEGGGRHRQQQRWRRRNLLVVQIGDSSDESHAREMPTSSPSSAMWLQVSSRPNRAYAKQWGMDYVMIRTPTPSGIESPSTSSSPSTTTERRQWMWPWQRQGEGARPSWDRRRASANPTVETTSSAQRDQFGLDVIHVVQTVIAGQEGSGREEESGGATHDDALQQQDEEPAVTYDALLLIPNNAVIIDLDYDLLRLIPEDSLTSLSRRVESRDKNHEEAGDFDEADSANVEVGVDDDEDRPTDLAEAVLFFNLQHPTAVSVVREWSDLALSSRRCALAGEVGPAANEQVHAGSSLRERNGCVPSGDARLLLQAIRNVGGSSDGASTSLVLNLTESGDGFVGREDENLHAIKIISLNPSLSSVSSAFRSNKTRVPVSGVAPSPATLDAVFALQTAADSVCYRYYPKCEVL